MKNPNLTTPEDLQHFGDANYTEVETLVTIWLKKNTEYLIKEIRELANSLPDAFKPYKSVTALNAVGNLNANIVNIIFSGETLTKKNMAAQGIADMAIKTLTVGIQV